MNNIIEPAAKRLFDTYYRYNESGNLEDLQYLTEDAYKLHERLRKQPNSKQGLFDLDEFLLLKALRNYSVHQGDFLGEAYYIDQAYAASLRLELGKVCLVKKKVLAQAINYEDALADYAKEKEKLRRIQGQCVDFGDFYNLEPVVFNFMVGVYELLVRLKVNVPGEGFKELDNSYKKETYFGYAHFVKLDPVQVDKQELLDHLTEFTLGKPKDMPGLDDIKDDPFKDLKTLELDFDSLEVVDYEKEGGYHEFYNSVVKVLVRDDDSYRIAMMTPMHVGLCLDSNKGELSWFNINQQKALLEKHNLVVDNEFYDISVDEFLVFSVMKLGEPKRDILWPVLINKLDIIKARPSNQSSNFENSISQGASGYSNKAKSHREREEEKRLAKAKALNRKKNKQAKKSRKQQRKKK